MTRPRLKLLIDSLLIGLVVIIALGVFLFSRLESEATTKVTVTTTDDSNEPPVVIVTPTPIPEQTLLPVIQSVSS